jgi:hypothetical protein
LLRDVAQGEVWCRFAYLGPVLNLTEARQRERGDRQHHVADGDVMRTPVENGSGVVGRGRNDAARQRFNS